jgi:hypothetical protein
MNYEQTINYLKNKTEDYQDFFINRLVDKYNLSQEVELKIRKELSK